MSYQFNVRKIEDGDNMSVSFDSTYFDYQSGFYYIRSFSFFFNGLVNVIEDDVVLVRDYYQVLVQDLSCL